MTKAYRTPPKGIKLPNGSKMQFGQLIGGTPMYNQRPLNSSSPLHPRNGAPKNTATEFAPVINHRSRTAHGPGVITGNAHEDEPLEKDYVGRGQVPVHPGMTDKQKAEHDPNGANSASAVLTEASLLGRKA
jgi:hypothetical protein